MGKTKEAMELLNRILRTSDPDATICLPESQAFELAKLSARQLGRALKEKILVSSPTLALEENGLFSRRIRIVANLADFIVNC